MDKLHAMAVQECRPRFFQGAVPPGDAVAPVLPADSFISLPGGGAPLLSQVLVQKSAPVRQAPAPMPPVGDGAVIYEPGSGGTFTATMKYPCDSIASALEFTGGDGLPRQAYTSRQGAVVNCMGPGGNLEMEALMPGDEKVLQMLYSEKEKALFVRTGRGGRGIYRVEPSTGGITAHRSLASFNAQSNRGMGFNLEGDLMAGSAGKLLILDGSLNEAGSIELDSSFRADRIEALPGGLLFCLDDGIPAQVAIISREGEKVLEEQLGCQGSTLVGDDGKVYLINSSPGGGVAWTHPGSGAALKKVIYYESPVAREIVRFDPATRAILRFEAPSEADLVIPLHNGSMLVRDNRLGGAGYYIYDREGRMQSHFTLGQGYLRQLHLDDGGMTAYLVVDSPGLMERSLHRVDLEEEKGLAGMLARLPGSKGAEKKPVRLFTENADRSRDSHYLAMVPAVLGDGRTVVFCKESIHLIDSAGREIRQYATSTELLKDLGPGVITVNHPYALGNESSFEYRNALGSCVTGDRMTSGKIPGCHDMLATAINAKAGRNPASYAWLPVEAGPGGCTYSESDRTLTRESPVSAGNAYAAMEMKGEDDYENLMLGVRQDRTLYDLALQQRIDIPVAGGRVTMERQALVFEMLNGKAEPVKKTFEVREPSHFTSVLPVVTGTCRYLFAGTDDGLVLWYDLDRGEVRQRYDAGAGVVKLLGSGDSVMAVTSEGGILVLRPRLGEGEHVGPPLDLSKPPSFDGPQKTEILEDEETLEIDGVKMKKRSL